ncbi:DUF695 domain-containing protein [Poseidonibacter lekithochrous]|uniref:DUF695 domain-containing protein n=1 Tax=Poseidonibacter lekithochrous TaxID=1904463 RepID=UPI0008FCC9C7|nr:DUF695 domain-containing protein [Poseidonibacter lekithochrous]QKJ22582.1 DUF695 domain-containing protein [Poseidonibacter lekithochrous]
MEDSWQLVPTKNINQMLRLRTDINEDNLDGKFKNLLVVKHKYHVADDIMFPDPSCLAFFTAFEQNHLVNFEQNGELKLLGVDIFEGTMKFFIYCDDAQKTVYDCISFLKSNPLFKCEFEIILNDNGNSIKKLKA